MRIINRIDKALGRGADERSLNAITAIGVHHSGNPTNGNHLNSASFENHWRGNSAMGFPGDNRGGYHNVVLFNGDVEVNMQDRRRVWGAAGQNSHTWHICCTGQHLGNTSNITQTQLNSLAIRIFEAMKRFGWTADDVNRIFRHKDLPSQSTSCNDIDIAKLRNNVRAMFAPSTQNTTQQNTNMIDIPNNTNAFATASNAEANQRRIASLRAGSYHVIETRSQGAKNVSLTKGVTGVWVMLDTPNTQTTTANAERHRVTARTGGFRTADDARNNRSRVNWIEVGEYYVFNRHNGMINVTSRQGVAGSWINPNTTTTASNIVVGSRVRVNANVQHWATGQGLPTWVRGKEYTVKQIRKNNSELLLADILSWIRRSDVTLI